MHTETTTRTASIPLSLKLASLQPKKRTTNQTKFAEHHDAIVEAIERGVSNKDIREALAEEGIKVSSATFKKLLNAERQRREARNDEAGQIHGGEA
jgi:DNA-binding transcriptional MerR regulator